MKSSFLIAQSRSKGSVKRLQFKLKIYSIVELLNKSVFITLKHKVILSFLFVYHHTFAF